MQTVVLADTALAGVMGKVSAFRAEVQCRNRLLAK